MNISRRRYTMINRSDNRNRTMSTTGCELDKHLDKRALPSPYLMVINFQEDKQETDLFDQRKIPEMGIDMLFDPKSNRP